MTSPGVPGPPEAEPAPASEALVKVLLFASARELAGTREALVPWAGLSLAGARGALAGRYGDDFGRLLASCAIWVNAQPAAAEKLLAPGDEVAVLPPVSGG